MNKLRNLLVFLAVFLAAALGFTQIQAQSVKGATLKYDAKKDTIYTPKIDTIKDVLTLAGSIDTDQIANLHFQNPGKLVWVGVKVGDHVRKGQAIASLDQAQLRKNLQTQFNNYRTSLSQFNDTQYQYKSAKDNLLVTDTIQRILDRTQYSLDNSVINYEITDMAIKESTIISPIDGIVVSMAQPIAGANIMPPSNDTVTIVSPGGLYFKADIDQESVIKIKNDEAVTLDFDSYPDKTFDSKISYISFVPVTGQSSTVYEVRAGIPTDQNLDYRIGMDGDMNIILSQADNALTVPIDAVNDDNGQSYVYLKKDNQLVRQNISIGIETDTTTQVTSGLTTNDQVVVIQK